MPKALADARIRSYTERMEQRKTIDLSELIDLSDMEPATPTPDAAVPDDAAQPSPAATEPQKSDFFAKILAAGKAFLTWLWGKLKAFAAWLWAKLKARWAWFKVQPPERKRLALAGAAACLAIVLGLTAVVIALSTNARQAAAAATMEAEPKPAAVQRTVLPENADELGPTEDWEDFAAADTEPLYTALKKHDTSDEVTVLQERLIALGYLEIDEPTDYYGSATEYAVKLFQRQHDLEQDGVAGDQTLTLLYSDEAQKYMLKEGAEGRDVKMLQEQLVDLGYLSSKQVDSVYGEVTQAAVVAFQKRNSLTADGKAGEKTLEKLYSDDAKVSSELAAKQKAEKEAAEKKAKEEASKAKAQQKAEDAAKAKNAKIDRFLAAARSKLGCEYILGDRGPDTFDCSGFVWYCLKQAGVSTTRLNAAGYSKKSDWKEIKSFSDVQKGDILFFRSNDSAKVSHTGIYIGSGMMIDASSGNGKVVKRAVSSYWKKNFVNARRPW